MIRIHREFGRDDAAFAAGSDDSGASGEGSEPVLRERTWRSGRHLIVSYYEGGYTAERVEEIRNVLLLNLRNPFLEKVHVFNETAVPGSILADADTERLVLIPFKNFGRQPRYADLFRYANKVLERGSIAIIANSDIEIRSDIKCARPPDPDLNKVMFNQKGRRLILSLSRHPARCGAAKGEINECLRYRGSHDAFVFAPPLESTLIEKLDFVQNKLGAENRLIWELRNASYRIANPCRLIKIFHHHCTPRSRKVPAKRFAQRGDGKYASVDPVTKFVCNDIVY